MRHRREHDKADRPGADIRTLGAEKLRFVPIADILRRWPIDDVPIVIHAQPTMERRKAIVTLGREGRDHLTTAIRRSD